MTTHSVLDRLIHKPVTISLTDTQLSSLQPGQMVVYKDDEGKTQSGEYLGYDAGFGRKGIFGHAFTQKEYTQKKQQQQRADELFVVFKEQFGTAFPTSLPLTARINYVGNQIYLYFYAETRYNFADFVREFRSQMPFKFFLYQVGSRDRVRLHPNRDQWFDPSGLPLTYSIFKHPLPNVDGDTVALQGLVGRDAETLKDRSGKLDHTLNFETYRYKEEARNFPRRGQIVNRYGAPMRCMGSNLLTQEIKLRGKDTDGDGFHGEWKVVSLKEYQTCIQSRKSTSKISGSTSS